MKTFAQRSVSGRRPDGRPCPPFKIIILDEAHNIEDSARESAGGSWSQEDFHLALNDCEKVNNSFQKTEKGALVSEGGIHFLLFFHLSLCLVSHFTLLALSPPPSHSLPLSHTLSPSLTLSSPLSR